MAHGTAQRGVRHYQKRLGKKYDGAALSRLAPLSFCGGAQKDIDAAVILLPLSALQAFGASQ